MKCLVSFTMTHPQHSGSRNLWRPPPARAAGSIMRIFVMSTYHHPCFDACLAIGKMWLSRRRKSILMPILRLKSWSLSRKRKSRWSVPPYMSVVAADGTVTIKSLKEMCMLLCFCVCKSWHRNDIADFVNVWWRTRSSPAQGVSITSSSAGRRLNHKDLCAGNPKRQKSESSCCLHAKQTLRSLWGVLGI